ncbi:hypothetical protein [Nitrososphaera viennensis]|uniref:Uncharacterized protein n=1 Tax=Nitrososphaera viennensis TaxID=1034015 RepID=A0A977ID46_9ARCH|nr:hypothetical protein [Nitrososphaera viennensis]UVS68743.1 hypothetical protein NWT39_12660 [Nitrososphaera viennensis]
MLKAGIAMVFAAVLLLVMYTDTFASKQPGISLEPGQIFSMTKYFAGTGNGETVGMFAVVLKEGKEVGVQVAAPDGSIVLKTRIGSKSQPVIGTFPVKQAGNYKLTIEGSNEQNVKFVAAFGHPPMFDASEPYLQSLTISAILLMIGFITTVAGFVVYFIDRRRNMNSPDRRMIQNR